MRRRRSAAHTFDEVERLLAEAENDAVASVGLLADALLAVDRLDVAPYEAIHPKGKVMPTRKKPQEAVEPKPMAAELAEVEAELAAIPGGIADATTGGDEAELGRLLLREPILQAKAAHLRTTIDTAWLDALKAHEADARARHAAVAAEQAGIIAELQSRLADAAAAVNIAWIEVLEARAAVEEETKRRPDWWWQEQGLAVPGSTPTAERVKERIEVPPQMASLYAEKGAGRRFGPAPTITYGSDGLPTQSTTEARVPVPKVVQDIVEGRYHGVHGE